MRGVWARGGAGAGKQGAREGSATGHPQGQGKPPSLHPHALPPTAASNSRAQPPPPPRKVAYLPQVAPASHVCDGKHKPAVQQAQPHAWWGTGGGQGRGRAKGERIGGGGAPRWRRCCGRRTQPPAPTQCTPTHLPTHPPTRECRIVAGSISAVSLQQQGVAAVQLDGRRAVHQAHRHLVYRMEVGDACVGCV